VDSYFLLPPASVGEVLEQTTEATTNLTQAGVGPIFAEVDTEEAQQTQQFVSTNINTLITRGY